MKTLIFVYSGTVKELQEHLRAQKRALLAVTK